MIIHYDNVSTCKYDNKSARVRALLYTRNLKLTKHLKQNDIKQTTSKNNRIVTYLIHQLRYLHHLKLYLQHHREKVFPLPCQYWAQANSKTQSPSEVSNRLVNTGHSNSRFY